MPRGRPPYPALLTPREQEVLALIAEGLTNEQIAERLGISFGGAKYHVGEILSKLGVNSREEAALHHHEPARSRFPALAPLMFWKRDGASHPAAVLKAAIAGGVAVAFIVGGFVLFPALSGRNENNVARNPEEAISADLGFDAQGNLVQRGAPSKLTSYYYEARVETGERPPPPGGRRPPAAQLAETYPTMIRSWFDAQEGSRWDALNGNQLVYRRVTETDTQLSYDGSTNTYQRYPLEDAYSSGVEVGPLPPNGVAGLFNPQDWKPVGQEVIAGRITQIVEYNVDGQLARIWVDTEYDFVLKHEARDSMNPPRITEVTRIDYDRPVSSQELAIELPPAAREVPAVTGHVDMGFELGTIGRDGVTVPEDVLSFSYLPDGKEARGISASHRPISPTTSMTLSYMVILTTGPTGPTTATVLQQYRAGGMTQEMRSGQAVSVRGGSGYRQSVPGEERLVFEAGDIIVTLTSATLPFEELLKIAEGMQ